ncbi:MAG: hypothetical protein LBM93_14080 [Oscillospiraceae bacterium]|jgi:hypothetical protein|nr:hypothetical protein [Oscillospiraceae bacterium]
MQLIKITSVPIEYQLRITNAELKLNEAEKNRDEAYQNAEKAAQEEYVGNNVVISKEITTQQNKTANEEKFFSNGEENDEDIAVKLAAEYDRENNITGTDSISQNSQSVAVAQSVLESAFSSRTPVRNYVETHQLIQSLTDNSAKNNNQSKLNTAKDAYHKYTPGQYVPGNVEMKVITKPKVDVEYIGGFMYVPPESNPDYEETFLDRVA